MYAVKCLWQVQTYNPHSDSTCGSFVQQKVRCQQMFFQFSTWAKAMLFLRLFRLQNLLHRAKDQIPKYLVEKPAACNRSEFIRLNGTQFLRQHSEGTKFPRVRHAPGLQKHIESCKCVDQKIPLEPRTATLLSNQFRPMIFSVSDVWLLNVIFQVSMVVQEQWVHHVQEKIRWTQW